MVRPVPKITIDFGNGVEVQRTLHGNVATYVCFSNEKIVDVLPGLYDPKTYQSSLKEVHTFVKSLESLDEFTAELRLYFYHQSAKRVSAFNSVQAPVKIVSDWVPAVLTAKPNVSSWKELYQDGAINDSIARFKIHDLLLDMDGKRPSQLTKVLYRDVLNVDLDDPYLGLGETLFNSYPFET